jgi:hypothetical protein
MLDILGVGKFAHTNYIGCWSGNDSEQLYDHNMKTRHSEMEANGWVDTKKHIVYKFNEWGFRSDAFESTGGIMFLGCSHVVGIGLPEHDTFSHIVSVNLNLNLYRMGIGAGSNDAAFRVADYWIPKLKPTYVVMVQTYNWRLELVSNDHVYNINTGHDTEFTNSAYYRKFIDVPHNGNLLKKKNHYAVQQICDMHRSKFISIDADSDMFRTAHSLGFARDLAHVGKKGNQCIAEVITNLIETA